MSAYPRPLARPVLVVAAVAALLFGWAAPALAHTELRASTPEEGSTVETLSELRVEFTDDVLDIGAELTVVDASGTGHELDPQFPSTNAVTGTLDVDIPAGETYLEWRVVAEDGHPVEGVVAFTYAPAVETETQEPAPSPSPEQTVVAEPTPEVTQASPEPTASAVPEDGDEDDLPGWVLPVIALAAAGGALVAILAARARQK